VTLLLDIGNTRIKWGWLDRGAVRHGGAAVHGGDPASVLSGVTAAAERPERVLAVSVAGEAVTDAVRSWVARQWDVDLRQLRAEEEMAGIRNGYRNPRQLGADRWAAVIGAYSASRTAVCVADCGSALTLDGVTAEGQHRGGLIMPGWQLMRRSLHRGTAALPLVDVDDAQLFARDTVGAIGSGTLLGLAAMVDQLAQRMAGELGPDVRLWLTGGDAPALIPHLRMRFEHAPDLVLQGLAAVADQL
jgi:type III pantothenate kinase